VPEVCRTVVRELPAMFLGTALESPIVRVASRERMTGESHVRVRTCRASPLRWPAERGHWAASSVRGRAQGAPTGQRGLVVVAGGYGLIDWKSLL
jgi:hypothetical protein